MGPRQSGNCAGRRRPDHGGNPLPGTDGAAPGVLPPSRPGPSSAPTCCMGRTTTGRAGMRGAWPVCRGSRAPSGPPGWCTRTRSAFRPRCRPNFRTSPSPRQPAAGDAGWCAGLRPAHRLRRHLPQLPEVPQCWITGQAAGPAAAIAANRSLAPRAIDVSELQDALLAQGVHLRAQRRAAAAEAPLPSQKQIYPACPAVSLPRNNGRRLAGFAKSLVAQVLEPASNYFREGRVCAQPRFTAPSDLG